MPIDSHLPQAHPFALFPTFKLTFPGFPYNLSLVFEVTLAFKICSSLFGGLEYFGHSFAYVAHF
jgi:hypothetical protein